MTTPIYDETAFAHGFAPMPHEPCPCAVDIAKALRDPDDELTVVRYTGHGLGHGGCGWMNPDRPDVRVLPLTGPQSPGGAW